MTAGVSETAGARCSVAVVVVVVDVRTASDAVVVVMVVVVVVVVRVISTSDTAWGRGEAVGCEVIMASGRGTHFQKAPPSQAEYSSAWHTSLGQGAHPPNVSGHGSTLLHEYWNFPCTLR